MGVRWGCVQLWKFARIKDSVCFVRGNCKIQSDFGINFFGILFNAYVFCSNLCSQTKIIIFWVVVLLDASDEVAILKKIDDFGVVDMKAVVDMKMGLMSLILCYFASF